jgi:hypothetical protein
MTSVGYDLRSFFQVVGFARDNVIAVADKKALILTRQFHASMKGLILKIRSHARFVLVRLRRVRVRFHD